MATTEVAVHFVIYRVVNTSISHFANFFFEKMQEKRVLSHFFFRAQKKEKKRKETKKKKRLANSLQPVENKTGSSHFW